MSEVATLSGQTALWNLSNSDLISLAALGVNLLAAITGLLLLYFTSRSLLGVARQMRSQAKHQIVDAHRGLFLEIIQNDALMNVISPDDPKGFQQRQLASILINHCSRIFHDYEEKIIPQRNFHQFQADSVGLFSMPIVRSRWFEVREYHSNSFREFIDRSVIVEGGVIESPDKQQCDLDGDQELSDPTKSSI